MTIDKMKSYLFDANLSLKAKGLLSILLTYDNIKDKQQLSEYMADGRIGMDNGIKELEENGYLQIIRTQQIGQACIFNAYSYPKFLN